jgi:predicted nuclease with TOPRIM domain
MEQLAGRMVELTQRVEQLAGRMDELTQRMEQLTIRMDELTQRVEQLAGRMDELTQRVEQLAGRMDELTQQVEQLTIRMDELTQRVEQLTIRMDELTQRVEQLAGRMDELTQRMEQLTEAQLRMGSDLEQLKGSDLERRYRERAHAYFSRLLRRIHVLSGEELSALLDAAMLQGQLSEEEVDEVLRADVVVRGRRREDGTETYLLVEVSWGVGFSDVQRASERAALLARIGTPVLPVVAGFWVTPEAQEPARALQVWQVTDGRVTPPGRAQQS